MLSRITSILLILFISFACTEQFRFDTDLETSFLIVDGRITNEECPYEVRLFRTKKTGTHHSLKPEVVAEEEAIISIYDDEGNSDSFMESSPGIYHNMTSSFRGIIGRSYWIEIQTSDGKKYESMPEVIPDEIIIEKIYGEETKLIQDGGKYLKGAELYIDAKSPSSQSHCMRWEYQESWEWHAPFTLPKINYQSTICYPHKASNNISIFDGSKQSKMEFKHLSTRFINENEAKLNYQYLLNVSLYSISPENYQFWENMKKSSQESGKLYDVIPANPKGNISSCEDDDSVTGYFEASSVNTKTQIFSIEDFDIDFTEEIKECEKFEISLSNGIPDENIYHIIESYPSGGANTVFVVRYNYCYDCNVKYSPQKPSFWP